MLGRDNDDPLFLQVKEAQTSVLEPFAGRSQYRNHGRRVVEGQRLMQAASDITLGWIRTPGIDGVERDFYIRQLWDSKWSAEVETMDARGLGIYANACGWTLARAHARSGDEIEIAAYLGSGDSFDRAIARFSEAYADQNERDHAALLAAIKSGRLEAETGV
jgi:predicted alpha/beta hydrolase